MITAKDVASVYEVPLVFANEGVDTLVLKYLRMEAKDRDLSKWAVSYTHLDVYKRQVPQSNSEICNTETRSPLAIPPFCFCWKTPTKISLPLRAGWNSSCLLYTSRCV